MPTRPLKVLIADDDLTTRYMLRVVLARWGYVTCEAETGEQAWAHLQTEDAAELALFDWIMPGLSGPEICQLIKQRFPEKIVYVILLTSKSDRGDVVEGLDSGADDFVVKPYDQGELRARLAVGGRMVRLRQELQEANRGLEERVRVRTQEVRRLLEFNEDLLHRLSHDLKTPLTPLMALLPMLHRDEGDGERRAMLEQALTGARSIHFTVQGVLELCRAAATDPVIQSGGEDVQRLVTLALEECRRRTEVHQRTLLNLVPDDLLAVADGRMTRRVLGLLLDNAVKFTGETGRITVRAESSGTEVRVSVEDDGEGLHPAQLPKVFEPFYKADVSRHDLCARGLGLPLARILVERQGGRMEAESAGAGQGMALRFTLPRALTSRAGPAGAEPQQNCL